MVRLVIAGALTLVLGLSALWAVQRGDVEPGSALRAGAAQPTYSDPGSSSTTTLPTTDPSAPPPPSSAEATSVCERRLAQLAGGDNPMGISLVAAYASTAADVAADDERRRGAEPRSPWRDRPISEPVAVCFFDADAFGVSPGQVESANGRVPFVTRLMEVVRPDGTPVVHAAGRRETLRATPIPARGDR